MIENKLERLARTPTDWLDPNELRQIKVPRRVIAALDALKEGSYAPRWAVIERLLAIREEYLAKPDMEQSQ